MVVPEQAPEVVGKLCSELSAWLAGQGFDIPVEWDARASLLHLGNRKGKTRTRFALGDFEAPGGFEKALLEAKQVVIQWRDLFSRKEVFARLPKGNQQDLTRYFGHAADRTGSSPTPSHP